MNIRYSAIALAVMGFSATAQESSKFKQLMAMDLGEMLKVEVATGTAKQLSEAPAVVSVITADDIKVTGARTLAEAVERVPGLHVASSVNKLTNLFTIRGVQTDNTPQILVLIDGVELSELTANAVPYAFHYPTNFIERIEIIRGPGSAVYGADAFSGVINIITKSPTSNEEFEVGLRKGSFDNVEGWFNANLAFEELKVGLSVTHEEQDDDSDRITPFGIMKRSREVDNIHLNATYGDFSFRNWYWQIEQKMGIGAGIIGNDFDREIGEAWKVQVNWDGNLSENIDGSVDISYSDYRSDASFQLFLPGVYPIGPDGNLFTGATFVSFPDGVIGSPKATTQKTKFNSSIIYSGLENHRIRFGLGGESSELTDVEEFKNFGPGVLDIPNIPTDPDGPDGPLLPISNTIIDVSGTPFIYVRDYDRDLKYISVQDEWKFAEKWELTAGVRYDDYSDFGSTTNPRLALVWSTTDTLTSKILYGTAFRAPKVSELAFVNNPSTLGNPDIQPEEIETIELAFDYRPSKNFTGLLNIYAFQSKDLIELVAGVNQNIGKQDGQGVEIEVNWQASEKLRINANISWSEAELPLSDEDKARVPGAMAHLDLRYQFSEGWLFTFQNYWIGERKRATSDTRNSIDDYIQTDATLVWKASSHWTGSVGVKNLFNDDIRQPSPNSVLFGLGLGFPDDFPMESRSIFGSINYLF